MTNKNKTVSALGAFSLSVGTAIGWGSFVITGSSFLSNAGPLGSIIGVLIGAAIMMVVAYNYHYMMNKFPDSNGGIYTYAKRTLGGDHAFLVSWFLIITYAAILWANVSSFSLFARYIFGNTFQFGFHYVIGGYDVWLGEILLSLFFLLLFGGICLLKKSISTNINAGLALIFISLIIGGFIVAFAMHQGGVGTYKPDFAPDGNNEFSQIVSVIGMMPWAFIGFESISHSSKNFKFHHRHTFKIFAFAIAITALLYILICQLSISVFPDEYATWYEYLNSSSSLQGLDGIPAFYVMHRYLGVPGLVMFVIALLAIIMTSLIGNMLAVSNLIYSAAKDHVFSNFLRKTNKNDIPTNAMFITIGVAAFMLFFGRVLIGWIVDVNTFCGIIVYAYIAIIAMYQARQEKNTLNFVVGIIGLVLGLVFAASVIINDLINEDFLAKESILIFIIWSFIGLLYYAINLKFDKKHKLGSSMIAIFGLFVLIAYSISSWLIKSIRDAESDSIVITNIVIGTALLILTQAIFFFTFSVVKKREKALQEKLILGLATMVEGRDNSTGGHIKRTSDVVRFLVEEMMKDPLLPTNYAFYNAVIKAAPMHDLGKIAVDDAILRKPGKFTPEEYAVMKKHPSEGARIVDQVLIDTSDKEFEQITANIAHYHHEKWDGSGYPKGLKGDEIPLEARIMAIADVYDALVSKRVYKEEFSFEDAHKIIIDSMGKHFDPGLEKYYIKARDKIEKYYRDLKNKNLDR